MHVVPESPAEPAPINSKARVISGGVVGALAWAVVRIIDDFAFTVTGPGGRGDNGAATLHTSAPEFGTAYKAERAAKAWCDAWVPRPDVASERGEFLRQASEVVDELRQAAAVEPAGVVGGWTVRIKDDRGAYTAVLEAPGRETEVLRGFERRATAIKAAAGWASANPCDGSPPFEEPSAAAAANMSTPFDELVAEPTLADLGAEPYPPRDDELTTLRARLAATETRLAAALARAPEDAATEYLALATREAELETQITGTKEILAGLKAELTRVRRSMTQKAVATMERISGRAPTEQLTISGVAFAGVGEAAARAAVAFDQAGKAGLSVRARLGAATWAFNGTEHPVEHMAEETADGPRYTAWISGRRPFTEGHGETLEQAVEACKLTASTLFADMEQAGEDTGVVADGHPELHFAPRKTEKRGRPAKLKGHDKAAVIAAVESVLTWPEAADALGCSKVQLEAYAGKVGLNLAKHQGRRAGEELALPEAPQAKAGKPRGRRYGATPNGGAK